MIVCHVFAYGNGAFQEISLHTDKYRLENYLANVIFYNSEPDRFIFHLSRLDKDEDGGGFESNKNVLTFTIIPNLGFSAFSSHLSYCEGQVKAMRAIEELFV